MGRFRLFPSAARFWLVLGLAGATWAQETLSSLQRDLDRVERETQREQQMHKDELARAAEFQKRKTERMDALKQQMQLTDASIDSLKREAAVQRRRAAGYKSQAASFQAKQKQFRAAIGQEIDTMMVWLNRDFPYQKEKRLSDWQELAKANQEESLPVDETLARLFSLVQASLDFGQDTEVYPGVYTATDGGHWEGTYVRLGAVLLAFASSDGKELAYLAKSDSGYVWRDHSLNEDDKTGIQTAIQVAENKVSPQLVPMPVEVPASAAVRP